jgi:peptide deformylase
MMEQKILLLGNPVLYEVSTPVAKSDIPQLVPVIQDLHDTLMAFRKKYHAGRAIAAPQIGIRKRILYMCIDKPVVFLNPVLEPVSKETMEVMDDCMSFPNLLVKVLRYKKCKITYRDLQWQKQEMLLEGDVSELLQHEYDHLDGILATMRAMDPRSFYLKETY